MLISHLRLLWRIIEMKNRLIFLSIIFFCCIIGGCKSTSHSSTAFEEATQVAQRVIDSINDNNPSALYDLLSQELQNQITKSEFIKNAIQERSYPYLTPLYLYLNAISLNRDGSADVVCVVASRLPGEIYTFFLILEDGYYRAIIFQDVVDGSFIDKFNHIVKW